MNFKKIIAGVLAMGIMTFLSGCLSGQGKKTNKVTEIAPMDFPEGVTLTGFYMTHQGMAMEPYYILRVKDDRIYMKTTNVNPANLQITFGMTRNNDIEVEYFGDIDTVNESEYASLTVVDEAVVRELEQAIVEWGALSWDGFSESRSMDGVLDAGDTYKLFLMLSDGSTVSVHGYNARPKHWSDLGLRVIEIFESHQDYSRYDE